MGPGGLGHPVFGEGEDHGLGVPMHPTPIEPWKVGARYPVDPTSAPMGALHSPGTCFLGRVGSGGVGGCWDTHFLGEGGDHGLGVPELAGARAPNSHGTAEGGCRVPGRPPPTPAPTGATPHTHLALGAGVSRGAEAAVGVPGGDAGAPPQAGLPPAPVGWVLAVGAREARPAAARVGGDAVHAGPAVEAGAVGWGWAQHPWVPPRYPWVMVGWAGEGSCGGFQGHPWVLVGLGALGDVVGARDIQGHPWVLVQWGTLWWLKEIWRHQGPPIGGVPVGALAGSSLGPPKGANALKCI